MFKKKKRGWIHALVMEHKTHAAAIQGCFAVINMSDMNSRSGYRWYALALAALTFTFSIAIPTMCMPVLFDEIASDLDLNLVQIGTVWGMVSLAGVFVVMIGGILGDRFGVKRVLSTFCILAGAAGALRGLSGDFTTLSATRTSRTRTLSRRCVSSRTTTRGPRC